MKEKIRGSLPDLLAILTGNLFLALTVVLFILPGELISCGTTGLSLLAKAFLPEAEIAVDAVCCAGVTPESHRNALAAMQVCQITVENG